MARYLILGGGEPRYTYILMGISIGAYIAGAIASGNPLQIYRSGYFYLYAFTKTVFGGIYPWQLVTSLFIHLDIIHIMFNMFFLFLLGTQLERLAGSTKLPEVYLISGLAGNILSLLMAPRVIVAGASGAIFGIFGYLIMFSGTLGGQIRTMLLYALFIFLINSLIPGVDIAGHLGGLFAGLVLGYMDGRRLISEIRRFRF